MKEWNRRCQTSEHVRSSTPTIWKTSWTESTAVYLMCTRDGRRRKEGRRTDRTEHIHACIQACICSGCLLVVYMEASDLRSSKWGPYIWTLRISGSQSLGDQIYTLIYLRARVKKKTSKMELLVNPINLGQTDISPKSRDSRDFRVWSGLRCSGYPLYKGWILGYQVLHVLITARILYT